MFNLGRKKINEEFLQKHLHGHGEPEQTRNNMRVSDELLIAVIKQSGQGVKEYYGAIVTSKFNKRLFCLNILLLVLTGVIVMLTCAIWFQT